MVFFMNLLNHKKEFYDFSEDILSDIIAEGYDKDEILVEFKNRKKQNAFFL